MGGGQGRMNLAIRAPDELQSQSAQGKVLVAVSEEQGLWFFLSGLRAEVTSSQEFLGKPSLGITVALNRA